MTKDYWKIRPMAKKKYKKGYREGKRDEKKTTMQIVPLVFKTKSKAWRVGYLDGWGDSDKKRRKRK